MTCDVCQCLLPVSLLNFMFLTVTDLYRVAYSDVSAQLCASQHYSHLNTLIPL